MEGGGALPIGASTLVQRCGLKASLRRRHHDLDGVLRRGELRLDGRAGRRVAGRDPAVPDGVHLVEGGDVLSPTLGRVFLRSGQ